MFNDADCTEEEEGGRVITKKQFDCCMALLYKFGVAVPERQSEKHPGGTLT